MYLSRLILDPWSRQVTSEMGDPYQMHRTLMRAFPSTGRDGAGRVLFRLDLDRPAETPTVLVQSENQPDWSFLFGRHYLMRVRDNPAQKPYNPSVRAGQRLRFLLRANPTVRRVLETGKPGKRIGLTREKDQIEWFIRKGNSGEFTPDGFRANARGKRLSRRQGAVNTHVCVDFEGVLVVRDPEKFLDTLTSGIGAGKAYGFGLLSIAPAREPVTCNL